MSNSIDLKEAELETLSEALETALADPKGKTRYGKIRAEMHIRYAESGTEQDIPTWDAEIKARQNAAVKTQTEAEDFLQLLDLREGSRRARALQDVSDHVLLTAYETTIDGDLAEELYDHLQSRGIKTADDEEDEEPRNAQLQQASHPALFKCKYGYYCDAESRLAAVKKSDCIAGLKEALDHDLQKTVRTAIERRLKKLESDLEASTPTQVSGLKSQPSEKAPAQALQTIGKGISDEQIAAALGRADQAAHDYLTKCLLAGATLCAAKAATNHGEWQGRMDRICKSEAVLQFCQHESMIRTARYYMKLWRAFLADLDAGEVVPFADQSEADQLQDHLSEVVAIDGHCSLLPDAVTTAIKTWIGEEGSIRGLLDRLGRAEREADLEEDEANKDHSKPANAPPPSVQTNFEATLFDERQGLLTRLRHTLNSDVYTTLPKSEWQRAFGEIEPLYQLLRQRAGF